MRAVCIASILGCVITSTVLSQQAPPRTKSILATDLYEIDVIGKLDVPLGTVVDIEATIISGDSLRAKVYAGQYLLSITKIQGKMLEKPRVTEFKEAPGVDANLRPRKPGLFDSRIPEPAGHSPAADKKELEKKYVGQQVRLQVYELGEFDGAPKAPEGFEIDWQDTGFRFRTYLRVLRRYE